MQILSPSSSSSSLRRPRGPHVLVVLFGLTVLTGLLALATPGGAYERDAAGRVVPGSFAFADDLPSPAPPPRPQGPALVFAIFTAPLRGIEAAAPILAFILVVGGVFRIVDAGHVFELVLRRGLRRIGEADFLVVPAAMLVFSLAGAFGGLEEGIVPFVLLLVPLVRMFGYHPIVAVAVPLIGFQVGCAAAMVSPSALGVAQAVADVPALSGWPFRTALWVVVTALGIAYVMLQARRWGYDEETLDPDMAIASVGSDRLTTSQRLVVLTLTVTLVVIVLGMVRWTWSITEIGAVLVAAGIVGGLVSGLSVNQIGRRFASGARELLPAALVVGVGRGIVVLATETRIVDLLLHGAATNLARLPATAVLPLMFLFQGAVGFFVPTGSEQAALTLPVLAPLAEQLGLSRQMAVLAFQLGGVTKSIFPTSVALMASLEVGKVSFERWFAFAWRLQLWLVAFALVALAVAYGMGFGS